MTFNLTLKSQKMIFNFSVVKKRIKFIYSNCFDLNNTSGINLIFKIIIIGFSWNHETEPQTHGIWIWSKPFIIKQSIGKQIAILLIDSQGVYDQYTDLRDWSTIVGITLLTSSCFIFNVFTDIQENVLQELETFLNYGRLAAQTNHSKEPVFQKLV